MTARTKTAESGLDGLPGELLEAIDKTRGETARGEWIAETLQQRLDSERADAEPVEDLDETPRRGKIRFRKKLYELRNIQEFGPIEQHTLNREGKEFAKLWNSDSELSHENTEGQRVMQLLDHLFDEVLDAGDEVREQFSAGEKARVVLAFTVAPARQLAELARLIQNITSQPGSDSA